MPRYELFLKELVKLTPDDDIDFAPLIHASCTCLFPLLSIFSLEAVKLSNVTINKEKAIHEARMKMSLIQNQIDSDKMIVRLLVRFVAMFFIPESCEGRSILRYGRSRPLQASGAFLSLVYVVLTPSQAEPDLVDGHVILFNDIMVLTRINRGSVPKGIQKRKYRLIEVFVSSTLHLITLSFCTLLSDFAVERNESQPYRCSRR